jgi:hypothetical protein
MRTFLCTILLNFLRILKWCVTGGCVVRTQTVIQHSNLNLSLPTDTNNKKQN